MGSGSSSSKSNTPSPASSKTSSARMPEPSSRGTSRGRRQFEEVQFEDPNAARHPAQGQSSNGYAGGLAPQANYGSTHGGGGFPPQAMYGGGNYGAYGGYSGLPQDQWQHAGHVVNTQQRVANTLQSHYQQAQAPPQLTPQPNQDPDEFLSMALQMQELGEDDIVFETFHHNNGRSYTCIKQSGKRHYLDNWDTQEWQTFPSAWVGQGHFTVDGEPIQDHSPATSSRNSNNYAPPTTSRIHDVNDIDVSPGLGGGNSDDRAGTLRHPTRGRLLTYIFEEKRNIHCYFDEDSGMWVKMPVSWEQHSDFIKPLIRQTQEAVPMWKDKYDIIAALRQSNYDPDDAISTYFAIGDTGVMDRPERLTGVNAKLLKEKDEKISVLQDKYTKLQKSHKDIWHHNKKLQSEVDKMKAELEQLREQCSTLEVEAKTASLRLAAMQQERPRTGRPVTARRRAPTPDIETAEPDTDPDSTFDDSPKHAVSPPQPAIVVEPQGPTIDTDLLISVNKAAKELDKSKLTLKKVVTQGFEDLKDLVKAAVAGLSKMKNMDSSTSQELEDLKVLYKKECLQRKLLYNQLQELRGNIRVFCRVRYDSRTECCLGFPDDQEICATNPAGKKMTYTFDKVFTPASKQTEVFDLSLPIITSCVDGYNICIMAYGQTGSGKTYTMMGTKDDPGVNVRSIRELLRVCTEREQVSYTLKVSMLEVYNEALQDLLCENSDKKKLDIKMQGKRLLVQDLTEIEVCEESDITRIMEMGDANRSVAATKMNSTSSRSHLLLILNVEGVDKVSKATSYGSLMLVDLAGSERIAKTGATGQTLVEAAAINKSLTSLGQVFHGLRTSALHVPYRNSKLTHLLQQALGGDAKACLFVNVSPDVSNISETLSTLQFGANAKQVSLGQATRNVSKGGPKK
ncbi:kinesin-like protein KIN-14M [Acanthaster planci]|uniref:Kinesin-like protein n=1 Tax=Acanthaster planci TaxID=133434 RepID=A0A8B7Z640_ACAPL|nr:kinesin-like protein KIN-14M [Acanthaster planci]